jgi:hypothetical protein
LVDFYGWGDASTFGVLKAAAVTWSDGIAPGHALDAQRWPSTAKYLAALP